MVIVGIKSQMLQSSDPDAFDEPSTNSSYSKQKRVFIDDDDIDGETVENPQKGINIVRYSDGTTRKILVQ